MKLIVCAATEFSSPLVVSNHAGIFNFLVHFADKTKSARFLDKFSAYLFLLLTIKLS